MKADRAAEAAPSDAAGSDVAGRLRGARGVLPTDLDGLEIGAARARYRAHGAGAQRSRIDVGPVADDSFAGRAGPIPVRRYLPAQPAQGAQPAILFFHGGGWAMGDLDTHDGICRHVVRAAGLQLVAVDYRLAPEHPYPAAVEDAVDAHAMLMRQSDAWNVDPDRLIVMGDGSGGTLASVVALHARDMCLPIPRAQVLFYPIMDMLTGSRSLRPGDGKPVAGEAPRRFRDPRLGTDAPPDDWRLSPLGVRSLAGSPATFITVAGRDPLRDDGLAYAGRLSEAGVDVVLRELPGQVHGYLALAAAEAGRSIAAAADFLRAQLG